MHEQPWLTGSLQLPSEPRQLRIFVPLKHSALATMTETLFCVLNWTPLHLSRSLFLCLFLLMAAQINSAGPQAQTSARNCSRNSAVFCETSWILQRVLMQRFKTLLQAVQECLSRYLSDLTVVDGSPTSAWIISLLLIFRSQLSTRISLRWTSLSLSRKLLPPLIWTVSSVLLKANKVLPPCESKVLTGADLSDDRRRNIFTHLFMTLTFIIWLMFDVIWGVMKDKDPRVTRMCFK